MGSFSIWHWMIVLLVVLLLFGSGKISTLMGDFAKGIKSFKNNMKDDEADASMAAEAHPQPPAGNITGPSAAQQAAQGTAPGTPAAGTTTQPNPSRPAA